MVINPFRAYSLLLACAFSTGVIAELSAEPELDNYTMAIRAQLRPINHTVISAGVAARLATFPKTIGETVVAGEVIATFSCARQQASLGIAETKRHAAQQQLTINQRLQELDNISLLNVSLNEAELSIAESEVSREAALFAECEIRAPFTGEIVEKHVQAFQHVNEGEPLLRLVDSRHLEIEMVVSSLQMAEFRPGQLFLMVIEETGDEVQARVSRVVGMVDPVSQTVRIVGKLIEPPQNLLPGMSGNILRQTRQIVP
jgi:membrane fusion protein (multidrug efflux system)